MVSLRGGPRAVAVYGAWIKRSRPAAALATNVDPVHVQLLAEARARTVRVRLDRELAGAIGERP